MGTLADKLPGTKWKVVAVDGADAIAQRLMEMGLVAGTELEVVKLAPLGDPIQITLLGYQLTIRGSEARRIRVSS